MSLFDLSGVVALVSNDTITVTRFTSNGYDANGRAAARTSSTFTVTGSAQPGARQLNRDPDGNSESADLWSVFTSVSLLNGDRLQIGSDRFEVERVEGWETKGNYCEAIARKLDPSEA